MLFDARMQPVASHAIEFKQVYPENGWVEHDPEEIWHSVVACCRAAAGGVAPGAIVALGIANQRETTVLWDRATGKPVHNAIVWQDRRTADICRRLKEQGRESLVTSRTGLLLDPYFSATKIAWLLDNVSGARARAERGELAFGTVDSFVLYRLTHGMLHATDITNASRTMLFDLKALEWADDMLALFGVPRALLPEIRDSSADFGVATDLIPAARIAIRGVVGDQQAAAFGQACFATGDVKATFGTGCFVLLNTGCSLSVSSNRLLATVAVRTDHEITYALEGSIFVAGSVVQWLRDGLGIIRKADEIEALAAQARRASGLYFVPAFTGLGAPWWDPDARGAILGLTRDVGAAEIARAALDAVCFQTRDLLEAMRRDTSAAPKVLKVDGGMVRNDRFCQRLADLTGLAVARPRVVETTARGAACLAGLASGLLPDRSAVAATWKLDRLFEPEIKSAERDSLYEGWKGAVARVRSAESGSQGGDP